jgi:dephospho-CoA kinase
MLRVGLTGGIASGKTTVGAMFVELSCHLIDSDQITHELLKPGQEVQRAVIREFGPEITTPDGSIDRAALGGIVFAHPERRETLNRLVHPAVIRRQNEFLKGIATEYPDGIGIVDAALMVEVGTYKNYECLVVVTCRPEQQRERLLARGLSVENVASRIESQMPMEEKARYAAFVVDNSGTLTDTRWQVQEIYGKLIDAGSQ